LRGPCPQTTSPTPARRRPWSLSLSYLELPLQARRMVANHPRPLLGRPFLRPLSVPAFSSPSPLGFAGRRHRAASAAGRALHPSSPSLDPLVQTFSSPLTITSPSSLPRRDGRAPNRERGPCPLRTARASLLDRDLAALAAHFYCCVEPVLPHSPLARSVPPLPFCVLQSASSSAPLFRPDFPEWERAPNLGRPLCKNLHPPPAGHRGSPVLLRQPAMHELGWARGLTGFHYFMASVLDPPIAPAA